MLAVLLFAIAPALWAQSDTMLTISEILFSDKDPLNTFIELYNLGTSNISLDSTTIQYCDKTTGATVYKDTLKKIDSALVLHSHQFAVILNHDYIKSDSAVLRKIPKDALRLTMPWNFCKDNGLLNALEKNIYLYHTGTKAPLESFVSIIDSVTSGYSVEKINLTKDNSAANWKTSKYYRGTPGRVNSATPKKVDAAITQLTSNPAIVFSASSPLITIGLLNNGASTLGNYTLKLYKTAVRDSIASKDTVIFTVTAPSINSGDTAHYTVSISCKDTGLYNFIAKVTVANDEDAQNDTLSISFHAYKQTRFFNDVVLNELMYAPSGDMPEWVEVYNRCADTINLKKWRLSDPTKQSTITSGNIYVAPHTFYIIARDSLPVKTYPKGTPILITTFPTMNNDGDFIALKDSFGVIIDSIAYSPHWGGSGGTSLERLYYDSPSNDSTNWASSLNPRLCTPGFLNSVTPKEYDISISSFTSSAAFYSETDTVSLIIKITNRGIKTSNSLSLQVFHDVNKDSSGTSNELIFSKTLPPFAPWETDSLQIQTSNFSAGTVYFIASVTGGMDDDTSNNYRFASATIIKGGNPSNKIVINEIMYAPPTGEPEWVELYNRSADSLNLQKFHLADDADTSAISKNKFILEPGGYCVVSRDSSILKKYPCKGRLLVTSFPTLNNDGDKVILLDSLYRVVDSLAYLPEWSSTVKTSLERISFDNTSTDARNWLSAETKYRATPGYINSVTPKNIDIVLTTLSSSPAYPVKGDVITPTATIRNNGTATAADIHVSFSFQTGSGSTIALMDTVISTLLSKDSVLIKSSRRTSAITDGLSIHAEAVMSADEDTSNNYLDAVVKSGNKTGTVVLNEIMFNPLSGYSEWIELYNTTNDTISLLGWRISDVLTTPTEDTINNSSALIPPQGYFVICRDTLPLQGIEERNHLICAFGILNNAADGVVIKDSRGAVIDSVFYYSDWNTRAGRSLERISVSNATNDSLNWLFSYDSSGGTPGKKNSVNSVQAGTAGALVINEIMYEPGTGNAEFVELFNASANSVLLNAWTLTTANKNLYFITDTVVNLPPQKYFIVCSDSICLKRYPFLQTYPYTSFLQKGSLGLLNSNTSIVLKDAFKNAVDSVYYRTSWHNPNFTVTKDRSLERINPVLSSNDSRNWSSSASKNGATPGEVNSIYVGNIKTSSQMSISPNPFSPDNDGFEDFTSINFQTPFPMSQITIKIFDDKGRLMRELTNNESFGSSGTIIYDGRDGNGNPLRLGMYIVLFEAVNPQTGAKLVHKAVLVSARKL